MKNYPLSPDWKLTQWQPPSPPDSLRTEQEHAVALLARQEDFDCLLLGSFGMSLQTIADYTGLSRGQVGYRLKKGGISVTAFRQGHGPFAGMVFNYLGQRAAKVVTVSVRKLESANVRNGKS